MFVLGFIVGLLVAAGGVWLLVRGSNLLEDSELPLLLARRRIGEVEQAAIRRMLAEAEASREAGRAPDIVELDEYRP